MGEHYKTYAEVVESLSKKKRKVHLLLGNGFSMAYDPKIFSYNALYDFVAALGRLAPRRPTDHVLASPPRI